MAIAISYFSAPTSLRASQGHLQIPLICRPLCRSPFFHVSAVSVPRRSVIFRSSAQELHPLELSMAEISIEEIMTPHPVVFHKEQTVKEAARLMIEKDVSGGPVVDDAGSLVGVLTENDIMWKGAGVPMDHFLVPPVFIGAFDLYFFLKDNAAVETELKKILAKKVVEAMTIDPVSIKPEASMSEASRLMLKHRINSLPVVDGSKVVGVVTRHDVLRALIASHSPLLE